MPITALHWFRPTSTLKWPSDRQRGWYALINGRSRPLKRTHGWPDRNFANRIILPAYSSKNRPLTDSNGKGYWHIVCSCAQCRLGFLFWGVCVTCVIRKTLPFLVICVSGSVNVLCVCVCVCVCAGARVCVLSRQHMISEMVDRQLQLTSVNN